MERKLDEQQILKSFYYRFIIVLFTWLSRSDIEMRKRNVYIYILSSLKFRNRFSSGHPYLKCSSLYLRYSRIIPS